LPPPSLLFENYHYQSMDKIVPIDALLLKQQQIAQQVASSLSVQGLVEVRQSTIQYNNEALTTASRNNSRTCNVRLTQRAPFH
jgi:hypothetical protein